MVEMKQPFFSIAAAILFALWGLAHGVRSAMELPVSINGWDMPLWFSYAITGLMFVMAYFALTHLRHK